jgi:dTDP-4-dehydrorhamnose reductase
MTQVVVLGNTGMVGHAMVLALSQGNDLRVLSYGRNMIDALDDSTLNNLWGNIDYVINCVGIIWQAQPTNPTVMSRVNTTFPWRLQARCEEIGAKLIHVSTDCVFTGKQGHYTEKDQPDSLDTYGLSKYLGEPNGAMVIRTSIIGREQGTQRSLLEWARSKAGTQVNGYTNHFWNGVTSREFGRICGDIIRKDLWEADTFHVHADPITKHDLLKLLSTHYGLNLDIVPHDTPERVDRTLASVKPLCGKLNIPTIVQMVKEL